MSALAMRVVRTPSSEPVAGRVARLTDVAGRDMAIDRIERWRSEKTTAMIRARQLDAEQVRCLTIGGTRIDTPLGWS